MQDLEVKLNQIKSKAEHEVGSIKNLEQIEQIKIKYLGRKSELNNIMRNIKNLPADDRPKVGQIAQRTRKDLEALFTKIVTQSEQASMDKEKPSDLTLIDNPRIIGKMHPLTQIIEELEDIFIALGFDIAEGPEVETDFYNFEALNMPPEHPARSMQDTYYIPNGDILRSHTSSVQIRIMQDKKPPVRIISPGKVYRVDTIDPQHTPMFVQFEGLWVDKDVHFSDLKGLLFLFLQKLFGPDTKVRFRPSYYPYTEPSAAVDIGCIICDTKGCHTCSGVGWITILGSGMVHPNVLKAVNIDHRKYKGLAFGLGPNRIALIKHHIHDIRLFFENSVLFLDQF